MTSFLLGAAGVCQLLVALLLLWNRRRTPPLRDWPLPSPAPSVLVVVPARNEEANIRGCLEALLRQDYPSFRVRVVDDHSTDRTTALVEQLAEADGRLELLRAPPLAPGWLGKPHAIHAGTCGATADYLLFVDADLRLHPQALRRAVATAWADGAALLTVVPQLLAQGFWERAAQPVVASLLFSLLDPVKVNDPKHRLASANGPFLLFSRAGYERIGGHRAVAGEVVEDLRLAEAIKGAGLRLSYCHATWAARLRMYDSLGALVRGWSKNFHVALGRARWLAPLCALLILWVYALPLVALLLGAGAWLHGAPGVALPLLGVYGADWLARLSLWWNYGVTPRGARALGALVVAYILCNSAYRAAFGRPVQWRGRDCPVVSGSPWQTPGGGDPPRRACP